MFGWIAENWPSLLVGGILLGAVAFAIGKIIGRKKSGGGCCGGGCGNCGGCDGCSRSQKNGK